MLFLQKALKSILMDYKINAPTDGDEMIFRHADIFSVVSSMTKIIVYINPRARHELCLFRQKCSLMTGTKSPMCRKASVCLSGATTGYAD